MKKKDQETIPVREREREREKERERENDKTGATNKTKSHSTA